MLRRTTHRATFGALAGLIAGANAAALAALHWGPIPAPAVATLYVLPAILGMVCGACAEEN